MKEGNLIEYEGEFNLINSSTQYAIIQIDNEGIIRFWNKAAEIILGYTGKEVIGKDLQFIIASNRYYDGFRKKTPLFTKKDLSPAIGELIELKAIKKDGSEIPVELSISSIKINDIWNSIVIIRDISERINSELLINKKLNFEKFVNSISSRFLGNIDIDKVIDRTLSDIGNLIKASRVFLFLFDKDLKCMYNTHEWCADNIKSHRNFYENYPINNTPWAMKQLLEGNFLNISDVSKLPSQAKKIKDLFELNGIKSNLTLPLYINDRISGFLGFDDTVLPRNWEEEDFLLLKITSQIIGSALERKFADDILKESENKYRVLFNNSPYLIILMDLKGNIIDFNKTVLNYINVNQEELIGKNFQDLNWIGPQILQIFKEIFKIHLKQESYGPIEIELNNNQINLKWITFHSALISHRKTKLIQVIIEDITAKKESENILEESEEKYRTLFESIKDGIIMTDLEGNILDCNQALMNMLCYSFEEMKTKKFQDFTPKKWHSIEKKILDGQVLIRGYSEEYEKEYIRKDGFIFPVSLKTWILMDNHQKPVGFWAIVRDITERKKIEQEINQAKDNYKKILDSIGDALHVIDDNMEIVYMNPTFQEWLMKYGIDQDCIGKNFEEKFSFLPKSVIEEYKEIFESGKTVLTVEKTNLSGKNIYTETRKIPMISNEKANQIVTILRDITKQKLAEFTLKESEEKFRNLTEQSLMGILIIQDNQVKYTNQRATEIIGYNRIEILNWSIHDLMNKIHPNDIEQLKETINISNLNNTEMIKNFQFRGIRKNNEVYWVDLFFKKIQFQGKDAELYAAVDITERKITEKLVQEEKEKSKLYLDIAGVIIVALDINGNIVLLNKKGYEVLEYEEGELIGKNWFETCIPSQNKLKMIKIFEEISKGKRKEYEFLENDVITRSNQIKTIAWHNTTLFNKKGEFISTLSAGEDVTQRKISEEKLRESEERYRKLIEDSIEGVWVIDSNEITSLVNPSMAQMLGYNIDEMIGKSIFSFMSKKNAYLTYNYIKQRKKGISGERDAEFLHKKGDVVYVRLRAAPIFDKNGRYKGTFAFIADETERKKAEILRHKFNIELENEVKLRTKELNEAIEQQKLYLDQILKSSQFKTEFLATMSHELRTPLNAIIGFADLLLEGVYGTLTEQQEDFIRDIKSSAEHQYDMIKKILDISRIESGKATLKVEKIDIKNLLEIIISTFRPQLRKKDLKLELIGLKKVKYILGDSLKIKQIIYNILSNAIKFTKKGKINIEFSDNKNEWELHIKDTGIGIAKEDYNVIFKDFKRVDNEYTNSLPGSGLGLALTKRLINLHGGEIWFESKFGKGTKFSFLIPKNVGNLNKNLKVEEFLNFI
jgi:PAS domain S-box-containing protein